MRMNKQKSKRIAFFDRDGVINKKAFPHCYITKVDEFVFNKGIVELLSRLIQLGFEIIIVSNQRGIARGFFSEQDLHDIHTYMETSLQKQGIRILDIFYCPHNIDKCSCRKPKPGLLKQATQKYNIDLVSSILISDSKEDIKMATTFGIGKSFLIEVDRPSILLNNF